LLFACAFIANAASFVLPISNPANLVLYGNHMPPLWPWLLRFTVPSVLAIVATYLVLRWTQRDDLRDACSPAVATTPLTASGWVALVGIAVTAIALLAVSALDIPLGPPTAILGALTALIVLARRRAPPWPLLKGVTWSVLPLVAGLFVLVETLNRTGVIGRLAVALGQAAQRHETTTAATAGGLVAVASNLLNNLPTGLIASSTVQQADVSTRVIDALLIGVDLGPNLSVTGSLATILWLTAIRREGEDVGFFAFLKIGVLVMPPALVLAIAARLIFA
jgi:arsenical pump membrane protein